MLPTRVVAPPETLPATTGVSMAPSLLGGAMHTKMTHTGRPELANAIRFQASRIIGQKCFSGWKRNSVTQNVSASAG